MVRETVEKIWCDGCRAKLSRQNAHVITYERPGHPRASFDLCLSCLEGLHGYLSGHAQEQRERSSRSESQRPGSPIAPEATPTTA